jgi:hypothetical protein
VSVGRQPHGGSAAVKTPRGSHPAGRERQQPPRRAAEDNASRCHSPAQPGNAEWWQPVLPNGVELRGTSSHSPIVRAWHVSTSQLTLSRSPSTWSTAPSAVLPCGQSHRSMPTPGLPHGTTWPRGWANGVELRGTPHDSPIVRAWLVSTSQLTLSRSPSTWSTAPSAVFPCGQCSRLMPTPGLPHGATSLGSDQRRRAAWDVVGLAHRPRVARLHQPADAEPFAYR